MKELLEKWSQLEPHLCQLMPEYQLIDIRVSLIGGYTSHHVEDDSFTNLDLAWIQWAIQQAIVEKSYDLMTEYTPEYGYRAKVGIYTGYSDDNIAEALLTAYLKVLETDAQTKKP